MKRNRVNGPSILDSHFHSKQIFWGEGCCCKNGLDNGLVLRQSTPKQLWSFPPFFSNGSLFKSPNLCPDCKSGREAFSQICTAVSRVHVSRLAHNTHAGNFTLGTVAWWMRSCLCPICLPPLYSCEPRNLFSNVSVSPGNKQASPHTKLGAKRSKRVLHTIKRQVGKLIPNGKGGRGNGNKPS